MNETEQLLEQVADRVRNSAHPQAKPLPAPLSTGGIAHAEGILGFALPPLLTAPHTCVGDGGLGPEPGVLSPGQAVRTHGAQRASGWRRPEAVVPIADSGCLAPWAEFRSRS
ncbi:hypothetical protein [Streptomyces sp. NPDC002587]